jgi:hypothetical protein
LAVRILSLSDRGISLEFDENDMPNIANAIRRRYGEPTVEWHATMAIYRFGGCDFSFQNEWQDPCLVSSDKDGVAILKQIFADLTISGSR